MNPSDWSSDVCSSDLTEGFIKRNKVIFKITHFAKQQSSYINSLA